MVLNDNDFANQTDAVEQNKIGEMYFYGNGVEQSYEEAAKWYRLSADQGNADAQCNLGLNYEYGQGVEQSYEEAATWYTLAANQGNADAQCNLDKIYEKYRSAKQSQKRCDDTDDVNALGKIIRTDNPSNTVLSGIMHKHNQVLDDMGYLQLVDDDISESDQTTEQIHKQFYNDDIWIIFRDSLPPAEKNYVTNMLKSNNIKRDFKIEESINTRAFDIIGDSVIDEGCIVEDYLEELERVFYD